MTVLDAILSVIDVLIKPKCPMCGSLSELEPQCCETPMVHIARSPTDKFSWYHCASCDNSITVWTL